MFSNVCLVLAIFTSYGDRVAASKAKDPWRSLSSIGFSRQFESAGTNKMRRRRSTLLNLPIYLLSTFLAFGGIQLADAVFHTGERDF